MLVCQLITKESQSIIGKILERVLQNRTSELTESHQSRMQRGFTSHSSSMNAALIISEVQNEAKDVNKPLTLVTLDVCKAFDVVWQDSLLRKLYLTGVHGKLWLTLNNLYSDATSSVKWKNRLSDPFVIKQGVRQGGILSTLHYKLFNNNLLHMIEDLHVGACIGSVDCSCPTCADDVGVLGEDDDDTQEELKVVRFYSKRERYSIQPQKCAAVPLHRPKGCQDGEKLRLEEEPIQTSQSEIHLGVDRNPAGSVDIKKKIQLGRALCTRSWEQVYTDPQG